MTIRPRKTLRPRSFSIIVPTVSRDRRSRIDLPEQQPGEFVPQSMPMLRTWNGRDGVSYLGNQSEESVFRQLESRGAQFSFRSIEMGGHPSLDEFSSFMVYTPGKWTVIRLLSSEDRYNPAQQSSFQLLAAAGYNIVEVDNRNPQLGDVYG